MTHVDLLIVGGGITGLGVARLAARNGWSVALIERGDLASGASSATSHMLHGGLRYLEHGHFALVRESLSERSAVAHMAPALATPTRFLVPLYRGDRVAPWKLRLGLSLYDVLAGAASLAPHTSARAREALAMEPDLAAPGLRGAGLYSDIVMDDARLAIAVARDAADHGATVLPATEITGARPVADPSGATAAAIEITARTSEPRTDHTFLARLVLIACGAWSDRVRRDLLRALRPGSPDPSRLLRPTRGIHLVYPSLTRSHAVALTARADGRVFFVVPFAGRSLVGTTEVEVPSPPEPDDSRPSLEEIRYLSAELARALPGTVDARPIAAFAGVRPLLDHEGAVSGVSREHRVIEDGALLTVVGGKYTTFRAIARDALAHAARRLGRDPHALRDDADALPPPLAAGVEPGVAGADAAERQFATTLEGAMRRRTTLWLGDDRGLAASRPVAGGMARRLGWSPEREREELDHYESGVREERALLSRALPRGAR